MKKIKLLFYLRTYWPARAQNNITISGYIKDAKSGNDHRCFVYNTNQNKGVQQRYDFFAYIKKADTLGLIISSVGYTAQ